MIYLDNAATGGFKPNSVIESSCSVIKYLMANPGRSGHKLSQSAHSLVYSTRKKLQSFFNSDKVERVIFTKNCTEASNIAIHGSVKNGGNVITTCFEHNSTLRPLFTLKDKGLITLTIIKPENGEFITYKDVEKALKPDTYMVAVNSVSNVNGAVNDVRGIGNFLKDKNVIYFVDGAQGAGHIKIDMQNDNINLLSLAGHKGLYGIMGSGALILNGNVDLTATYQGGTGTETFNLHAPDCYPEKLECGTLNLPAICSLFEGVTYIEENLNYISNYLIEATSYLIENLKPVSGITVYSKPNPAGIVAISHDKLSSQELTEELSKRDIATRGGYHCAPLMHEFLKTQDGGLTRISVSHYNTKKDLILFLQTLNKITCSL